MVSAIGQIALTVTNLPRALQFYRDTLGLKFLFEASNMAFFDCGGVHQIGAAGIHLQLHRLLPDG